MTAHACPDWDNILAGLRRDGHAVLRGLVDAAACDALMAAYDEVGLYRSRVVMERHGFGQGEYKYFAYPLPALLQELRQRLYGHLMPVANEWQAAFGEGTRYPARLEDFLETCHTAGQSRPTPLILRYGSGGYNCLHQDLYGALAFPLQVAILLSQPGSDFTGGAFVLTEQRPRQQSRATVVELSKGDAVVFAVHHRPVAGKRGTYRVNMRHGVSTVESGSRYTLGMIFHDAT